MLDNTLKMEEPKEKEPMGKKMKKLEIEVEQGMEDNIKMVEQTLMEIDN